MHLCPHCGYDLQASAAVEYGNVGLTDSGRIELDGQAVGLARCQHEIVSALVRARGRCLTLGVLANLLEGEVNDHTIVKYVQRARIAFRALDPEFDQIESMRGFGAYRWRYRDGRTLGGPARSSI